MINSFISCYFIEIYLSLTNIILLFHLGLGRMLKKNILTLVFCLSAASCSSPLKEVDLVNVSSLSKFIADNNGSAEAYNVRGIAYAKAGNYTLAINDFNKAIAANTSFTDAYINRASVYMIRGMTDRAWFDYKRALIIDEENSIAYIGLADLSYQKEDYHAAADNYEKAANINPKSERAWYGFGLSLQGLNMHEEAVKAFFSALSNNQRSARTYLARGLSYFELEEFTKATTDFRLALKLDSNLPVAWFYLATLEEKAGRYKEAISAYEAAKLLNYNVNAVNAALERLQPKVELDPQYQLKKQPATSRTIINDI